MRVLGRVSNDHKSVWLAKKKKKRKDEQNTATHSTKLLIHLDILHVRLRYILH